MPAEELPPSPVADLGPSDLPAAEPSPATAAEAAGTDAEHPATPQNGPEDGMAHRRRRRRRHRPARDAAAPAVAGGEARPGEAPPGEASLAGDGVNPVGAVDEPAASPGGPPAGERPHRRRRRRRRAPLRTLGSALQPVAGDGSPATGEHDDGSAAAEGSSAPGHATLHLRLPVRPRRRLARPPGLARSDEPAGAPGSEAPAGAAAPAAPGTAIEFPRRRRRRRPPPRAAEAGAAGTVEAGAEPHRPPPRRGRQFGEARGHEGPAETGAEPSQRGPGPGRGPRDRARETDAGGAARRGGERSLRGRSPGGGRDGRRGGGRDASRPPVPQKLYALQSMVDRGFEDVPDEGEDGGTRRVPWTIVKRTVADQKSGKPMSAVYVLQRDGGETEFPNLGAARAAANKTIVHPEKLTMSKAEHAAAKNSK
jgi:hypothetical protein